MKQKMIEHYITESLAKSKTQHRKISAVLAEAMPEVCTELRRMATAEKSGVSDRKFAIAMLENVWRTLLTTSQSETRTAVKRLDTAVRAKRVKVAETQAALDVHRVQRQFDDVLKKAGSNGQ
jgi:hypothetical protein